MSVTSWVCAQVWSKVAYFRQGLGLLAATGEEVSVITENVELVLSACPLFSAWAGFAERQKWGAV